MLAALLLATPAQPCEVALALAVDVSGSIDAQEFRLQIDGLAEALRDAAIAEALVRARAEVMLVQWTGDRRQIVAVPWRKITDFKAALGFAEAVAAAPREWRNFSTAIGAALEFTQAQFAGREHCARRVIDVSGDGISNEGIAPASLRGRLWRDGFTVNGLAIENGDEDLTGYYWENVIVGENAFVMTADGFADYGRRMKLKLLREVTDQISGLAHMRAGGPG